MSYPENPNTIVLKNRFYPRGLKEIDIWNYYQRVRSPLLKEVSGRDIMLFIATDINKTIIKRKGITTNSIQLSNQNYDKIITGRTISIHSGIDRTEIFGIIDVDINDGFKWGQVTTSDVFEFVINNIPIVSNADIRYTGKNSFHIICYLKKRMQIDTIRLLLKKYLEESELSKRYTIAGKRHPGIPNLDLGRNVYRANFITLHSLSVLGLKCMEVSNRRMISFQQNQARI